MPARKLPRVPPPDLRYYCVWEGCENVADHDWRRNKWRWRLYCQKHHRRNVVLNKRLGLTDGPVGRRTGHRLARVAPGKFIPYHVARYRQLADDDRLAHRRVYLKNGRVGDVSLRNLGIVSNRGWKYRMVRGKELARERSSS